MAEGLSVPVIVKETGNGFSRSTARKLADAGVDAIDVAGKGGTTWYGVEAYRAAARDEPRGERLGERFRRWGIPTVASTLECLEVHDTVVASGGVRSGIDIAKAVALGATAGGLAKPFLSPSARGTDAAVEAAEDLIAELETAMFVTGSRTSGTPTQWSAARPGSTSTSAASTTGPQTSAQATAVVAPASATAVTVIFAAYSWSALRWLGSVTVPAAPPSADRKS